MKTDAQGFGLKKTFYIGGVGGNGDYIAQAGARGREEGHAENRHLHERT